MTGIGQAKERVRLVSGGDLGRAMLSAQDGFVLSRVDGQATLETLCKLTGLGEKTTLDSLRRLRDQGLIVIGDQAPPAAPRAGGSAASGKADAPPLADDGDGEVDLDPALRQRIRETHARLGAVSYFDLLGVAENASTRDIRRAYFARSKEFHPDRYYNRRNLGRYREWLGDIFKQVAAAYRFLEDDEKRDAYREMLVQQRASHGPHPTVPPAAGHAPARTGEAQAVVRSPDNSPAASPAAATLPPSTSPPGRGRRMGSGEYSLNQRIVERVVSGHARAMPIAAEPADETSLRKAQATQGGKPSAGGGCTGEGAPASALGDAVDALEAALSQLHAADEAREQRRDEDRLRRRKMTVQTNPLEQRRKRAAVFYEQGMKQIDEGKILAAAASLKLAVTYDPLEASYKAAYEKAAVASREVTAESYLRRATFQESIGRVDEAAVLYGRAAEACPTVAYLSRAALGFLAAGKLPQAREYATHSVSVAPNSVEARIALARVHVGAGSTQHARRELEMALKLQPENSEAKQLLRSLK